MNLQMNCLLVYVLWIMIKCNGIITTTFVVSSTSKKPFVSNKVSMTKSRSNVQKTSLLSTSIGYDNRGCTEVIGTSSSSSSDTLLIPEMNPYISSQNQMLSSSGVLMEHVLDVLHTMYPAESLHERNALSRTDGYWPYLRQGDEPPSELTYGEFDFYFFAECMEKAIQHYNNNKNQVQKGSSTNNNIEDIVFTDLGSGAGRLVFAAAALYPDFRLCRGVELLQGISDTAKELFQTYCQPAQKDVVTDLRSNEILYQIPNNNYNGSSSSSHNSNNNLLLSPIQFDCGSFDDPYTYFGDSNILFCFSSCFDKTVMEKVSNAIGRQCTPGTVVITTDYQLPLQGTVENNNDKDDHQIIEGTYRLSLIDKLDGWCWLTGGDSTAYMYHVEESCATSNNNMNPKKIINYEDNNYNSNDDDDDNNNCIYANDFIRYVYNDHTLNGIP